MSEVVHINPVYLWYCGRQQFNSNQLGVGLFHHTTNESHVTCPACLALKPVDISSHPLAPFFAEVAKEYNAGKKKYGEWLGMSEEEQVNAVRSEIYEWQAAVLKSDGGTRERSELPQLANVAGKRWIELQRGKG